MTRSIAAILTAAAALTAPANAQAPELTPEPNHTPNTAAAPDAAERFNIEKPFSHAAAARIFTPDRRIDATRINPQHFHLDFHAPTGAYFAVASWSDGWGVYRSTNNGLTWTNTYFFNAVVPTFDVDLVATDDWVYIAYAVDTPTSDDWARLRRVDANTGLVDNAFSFQIVFEEDGNPVKEVELAADADDQGLGQGLLYTALYDDGSIRYAFDQVSDGTTFSEITTGITNANNQLNFHYNANRTSPRFAFLSFVNNAGDIQVYSRGGGPDWDLRKTIFSVQSATQHSLTAAAGLVMVSFADTAEEARYEVSYDAGDTWFFGSNNASMLVNATPSNASVTARLGYGTARATTVELGADDEIILDIRQTQAPGAWRSSLTPEDNDVFTLLGLDIDIEALPIPDPTLQYRYGILWYSDTDATLRFDRVDGCPGDTDGDRLVGLDDLLNILSAFGETDAESPYDGDLDADNIIGLDDLLLVLSEFGNTCPV
mgnify:CR=1 FL=1